MLLLISKLVQDGAAWLSAELAVGKAEAHLILRRYLWSVVLGATAFAVLITALVVTFVTVAETLGQYWDNALAGGLAVGLALMLVAGALGLGALRMTRPAQPVRSRVLKILAGRPFVAGGMDGPV